MTKEQVKTIPWAKVVAEVEEIAGIPRKQVDDIANEIVNGINSVSEKNQPRRDDDILVIETPFTNYQFKRLPAANVMGPDGKNYERPSCICGNTSMPKPFVIKANIGLIDSATAAAAAAEASEEPEKKKRAS
jgi:hypothetical protein